MGSTLTNDSDYKRVIEESGELFSAFRGQCRIHDTDEGGSARQFGNQRKRGPSNNWIDLI